MNKKLLVILLAMMLACTSACGNNGTDKPSVQPNTEISDSIVKDDQTEKNESVEDNTEDIKVDASENPESTQNSENSESQPDVDHKENDKDSSDTESGQNGSSNNSQSNKAPENNNNSASDDSNKNNTSERPGNTGSNGNTGSSGNSGSSNNTGNTGNSGSSNNTGNTGNSGSSSNTGNTGNTPSPVETKYVSSYTKEENQHADAIIAKIIRSSMGEFERVKAIHDYLLIHVDYDYQNYMNNTIPVISHTALGAFTKKYAVCDGYSHAFELLCLKIGISCEIVTGTSKNNEHAWNQVKIDGTWYNIDVTWDDPAAIDDVTTTFNDHSGNSYEYFCIPDSIMYRDHQTSNAPHKCTAPALFERALKAGNPWEDTPYISSTNGLVQLIKTETGKGNYTFDFYIKASLLPGDMSSTLIDCVSQTGVKCSGLSWSYFTYFEGTTNPGEYLKLKLTIEK
ncbi:MAG: hypothetical protein IKJ16_02735 [Agathobacter sp.]|nr:hypothetical protein [Agathobacter sp.]